MRFKRVEPNDPIQAEEIILRRIPEAKMSSDAPRRPMPDAFDPHKKDTDGLSVYREHFHSAEEVCDFRTVSKNKAWVAKLKASSIFALGLTIEPDPLDEIQGQRRKQVGHCLIKEMNAANSKSDKVEQWKRHLAALVLDFDVKGPFDAPSSTQK